LQIQHRTCRAQCRPNRFAVASRSPVSLVLARHTVNATRTRPRCTLRATSSVITLRAPWRRLAVRARRASASWCPRKARWIFRAHTERYTCVQARSRVMHCRMVTTRRLPAWPRYTACIFVAAASHWPSSASSSTRGRRADWEYDVGEGGRCREAVTGTLAPCSWASSSAAAASADNRSSSSEEDPWEAGERPSSLPVGLTGAGPHVDDACGPPTPPKPYLHARCHCWNPAHREARCMRAQMRARTTRRDRYRGSRTVGPSTLLVADRGDVLPLPSSPAVGHQLGGRVDSLGGAPTPGVAPGAPAATLGPAAASTQEWNTSSITRLWRRAARAATTPLRPSSWWAADACRRWAMTQSRHRYHAASSSCSLR
jgi:hypothetical protein